MAISVLILQSNLANPSLSDLERYMLNFFEAQFDKELYLLFKGGSVNFKKQVYFIQPLLDAHVNERRWEIIYNSLATMYDEAGWILETKTTIGGEFITFTPKT